jgi:predicted transcriptional regulator/predicted nucleotidyltransferase
VRLFQNQPSFGTALGDIYMRIKRNEKIANIPIVKIRDYFKEIRGVGIIKAELGRYFNLNIKNTNLLINELLQNELIEKSQLIEKTQEREYQLTMKGQALCAARSVPPMNKEKADKIFKEFMQRVEEINNNSYYLCKIEKLLLFGSYLNSDKDDYGDIDIAFKLKRKIDNFDEYEKAREERIKEMKRNGKYFSGFMDESFSPENEVMLKLKNKCQYISLHRVEDEILKYAKYKQIYPVQT